MIGGYQVDVSVAVNLLMSVAIVVLSVWGYYKIKKSTPLYFGFAYTLFAISHFLLLTGGNNPPGAVFFVLRTGGYALVATGLFALLKDIILRQEVECDLRESRKRLAATFDQAAVGIAGILPGGHIAQVNRRFCDILGYTVTDILNVLPHTLIAPDDQRDTFEAIKRIMKGDLPGYTSEIQCIRKDGSSVWCELFISPVRVRRMRHATASLSLRIFPHEKLQRQNLPGSPGGWRNVSSNERQNLHRQMRHSSLKSASVLLRRNVSGYPSTKKRYSSMKSTTG